MIDDATLAKARAAKVYLKDGLRVEEPYGQYFKEHVRVALVEQFGRERVYEGGLKVYTTIDLNMQKAAEAAVAASLKDLDTRRAAALKARKRDAEDDPGRLQAALVAMDPDHRARARAGRRAQLRRQPLQSRHPGSSSAGLGVQAVRLRGRARSRLHTGQPHHRARPAGESPRRGLDAGRRAHDRWRDHDALRAADVQQQGRGADDRGNRHPGCRLLREEARHGHGARRAVAGAGFRRGHAAGSHRRLRHVRRRRHAEHARRSSGASRMRKARSSSRPSPTPTRRSRRRRRS